jgi:AcrR family transcriptional regulator
VVERPKAREALSRERIVAAAAAVADQAGLAGVTMRSVGKELGVEAMSLYHHIAGKDELLDLLADWIFAGIELPGPELDWREAMTMRAHSARRLLSAHKWALTLIESRPVVGPTLLRHHETVLGSLRLGGFPVPLATHAFSLIDAYVYGFVLTELNLPTEAEEDMASFVADIALDDYPHLAEMVAEQVAGKDFAYGDEFEFGLELILDGLAERLAECSQ